MGLASSRLRRVAQRPPPGPPELEPGEERCGLCAAPVAPEHRHVVDLSTRELKCTCRPCAILFDSRAAGGGHFRLVPDRRLRIDDFELDEVRWSGLRIPVEMAFFFHNTQVDRVVAFYPSPVGATESLLELDSWRELEAANPILGELEPDVEALLVSRARGAREHWLVPIDDCYDLVGLMRLRWKGLSGGDDVWLEIERFFERLRARGKVATRQGTAKQENASAA